METMSPRYNAPQKDVPSSMQFICYSFLTAKLTLCPINICCSGSFHSVLFRRGSENRFDCISIQFYFFPFILSIKIISLYYRRIQSLYKLFFCQQNKGKALQFFFKVERMSSIFFFSRNRQLKHFQITYFGLVIFLKIITLKQQHQTAPETVSQIFFKDQHKIFYFMYLSLLIFMTQKNFLINQIEEKQMGSVVCQHIQTSNQTIQITPRTSISEIEDERGPVEKYRSLMKKTKTAKFFPSSLLTLPSLTNTSSTILDITHEDFFKKETDCVSTDSVFEEEQMSENQFFNGSIGHEEEDDFSSIDLTPNSQNSPVKIKLENYVKCKNQDINNAYKKCKLIGRGHRGKIFVAENKLTNKTRAIKSIEINQESCLKKTIKFAKEIQILSKLDHPNLIRLYEIYSFKNRQFMVMDYCCGGNLLYVKSQLLKKSENPNKFLKNIFKQTLLGISYLHSKNVIHRNLRMKKILLLETSIFEIQKNVIKIIDFSLAQFGDQTLQMTKKLPTEIGQYASPEELNLNSFCTKSDIWALGVVLFSLLQDEKPFQRKKKIINGMQKVVFKKNEKVWSKFPTDLNSLLTGMLEEDPQKRFSAIKCLNHKWLKVDEEFTFINESKISQITELNNSSRRKTKLYKYVETLSVFKNIQSDELKQITEVFQNLDRDYSGSVQLQELIDVLGTTQTNFYGSDDILTKAIDVLKSMDADGSGEIDYHQFIVGLSKKDYIADKFHIEDIFEHFDIDNDGMIDESEFLNEIQGISKSQYELYLKKMGINDSKMPKQKFIQYLLEENAKYHAKQG